MGERQLFLLVMITNVSKGCALWKGGVSQWTRGLLRVFKITSLIFRLGQQAGVA